jgi:hypothetical protein
VRERERDDIVERNEREKREKEVERRKGEVKKRKE